MAENIDYGDLPRWVKKAYSRFERKLGNGIIDVKKTFVGRTFLYNVKIETLGQHNYSVKWTIEKRSKIRNKLILLSLSLIIMIFLFFLISRGAIQVYLL